MNGTDTPVPFVTADTSSRARPCSASSWVLASWWCTVCRPRSVDLCGTDHWVDDPVAERREAIVEQARRKHPVIKVANWENEIAAAGL